MVVPRDIKSHIIPNRIQMNDSWGFASIECPSSSSPQDAINELFPLVYDELRKLAQYNRRGWYGDKTLNTTALVHEAYLKLADQTRLDLNSRSHFFAVAAKAMRHILYHTVSVRTANGKFGRK